MGGISGGGAAPVLGWSPAVGTRLRLGSWAEKEVSTVTRIAEALAAGRREEAAQLVDYFVEDDLEVARGGSRRGLRPCGAARPGRARPR